MAAVTFQIIEGVDKGRTFRNVQTPVTIGREEGNVVRLNDERVSRFHAKVQFDKGEIVITDLESTNGTRVNGNPIQIRRLRPGDRVELGRSMLLFGTPEEIAARIAAMNSLNTATTEEGDLPKTLSTGGATLANVPDIDVDFILDPQDPVTVRDGNLFLGQHQLPPLPQQLSPAQAARISEILDFLHRQLTLATENIKGNEAGDEITIGYADWQRVMAIQGLLARYVRAIADPEILEE